MKSAISLISTLLAFFVISTTSYAECGGTGGRHCTDVTVDRVFAHQTGISIWTSGNEDLLNCDPGEADYLVFSKVTGE